MATASETELARPGLTTAGRAVRVGLLIFVWMAYGLIGTGFLLLSGRAGDIAAWRWAALVYLPLLLPTWLLVRRLRSRTRVFGIGMVVVVTLTFGIPAWATPGFERLERFAGEVTGPTEGVFLGDDSAGNAWCWQGCPALERFYAVPDAEAAAAELTDRIVRNGWEPAGVAHGPGWCRGDFNISIRPVEPPHDRPLVPIRGAPVGWETVLVRIGSNCL